MFNSVVNLWLFKVIPKLLAELCRHWQQCVCLFSESLFLHSEPALSCVWRTGRQTSAFTIIELIMFFLCYCPLFQKSPAKQKRTLEARLRLVTNIRPCLSDDIFRLELFVGLRRPLETALGTRISSQISILSSLEHSLWDVSSPTNVTKHLARENHSEWMQNTLLWCCYGCKHF